MQLASNGLHLLTSGRDSCIRLWDLRKIGASLPPVQTYASHRCKMYPIGAKFLYGDQFIVTGSEDNSAYLYETVSGEVARKVELGAVTHTEPAACHDLSFYVVLYRNQRLGLVDVSGEDILPELPSIEEQQRDRMKEAMQTALWEASSEIYQHLRVIGRYNMVGYGNLLEALQSTAHTDEGSRRLLAHIQVQYERKLAQSYLQLPPIALRETHSPTKLRNRDGKWPDVRVECSKSEPWSAYWPR